MSRHSEMWLAANASATTVLASARADRERVRRLARIPRPLVVTLVAVRPTPLDVEPVHLLHEAGRAVASLLGLEVTAREIRFWYLQAEGAPSVRIEVCGPCRLVEMIADVPEGHTAPFVEGRVQWIDATAAKWAKTPPEEPPRCDHPVDDPHEPGCAGYRPGPKVAP